MSEAELLVYLRTQKARSVCGFMERPVVAPTHYKRRRRLLAVAALFGWQAATSCAIKPPQLLPTATATEVKKARQVVIRGQVVDDVLHGNAPLRGVYVFIAGTEYGAITDEQGNFTLTFADDWEPVKNKLVNLYIPRISFATYDETVRVSIDNILEPIALLIQLRSVPERGKVKGKAVIVQPPVPLSKLGNKHR